MSLALAFVIHGWNTDDVDSLLASTLNAYFRAKGPLVQDALNVPLRHSIILPTPVSPTLDQKLAFCLLIKKTQLYVMF